jgi:hypothetical protein
VGVSEIVKSNPWYVLDPTHEPGELMRQAAWLQRFTIGASAKGRVANLTNAKKALRLFTL